MGACLTYGLQDQIVIQLRVTPSELWSSDVSSDVSSDFFLRRWRVNPKTNAIELSWFLRGLNLEVTGCR